MSHTGMDDNFLRLASISICDMHSVGVRWQRVLAQVIWVVALPSMFASMTNAAKQYCRMTGSQ